MKRFAVAFVDRFCEVARRSEYTVGFGPHLLTFRQGVATTDEAGAQFIRQHCSRRFTVLDDRDPVKKVAVEEEVEAPETLDDEVEKSPDIAVGEVVDDPAPRRSKKKKTKKGKK